MLAIIDYGQTKPAELFSVLNKLELEYKFTPNEYEIIKADKIIFAAQGKPDELIKELHLQNLFSLLRICKKSYLGIALGVTITAENFEGLNISGIGVVKGTASKLKEPIKGMFEIEILNNKLFEGIEGTKFYFDSEYMLPANEYATSTIELNGKKYAATIEYKNFVGLQFFPCMSEEEGITIINNWYKRRIE